MTQVVWVKSRCSECGLMYEHPEDYKPATCSNFDCVHKHIHKELKEKEIIEVPSKGGDVERK